MPLTDGLYWETSGPRDAPALILSPGLGGSAHYWQPNIERLAARHRLILYDHRGTGRSEALAEPTTTVAEWSHDLTLLMDAAGVEKASVLGHAAGGLAGLALALKAPERIDRLIIVNGWARPDAHTARCFVARLALLRDSGVRAYVAAQPLFLYPPEWNSAQAAMLDAQEDALVAASPPVATIEARIAALRAFDISELLGQIETPLLAIAAADDMLVPPARSAELVAGIPGARLETMAWGGHACNVTDAPAFDRIVLEFLGS